MTNTTMTQAERLTSLELEKSMHTNTCIQYMCICTTFLSLYSETLEVRVSDGESDIKLKEIELKSRDEELEKRKV